MAWSLDDSKLTYALWSEKLTFIKMFTLGKSTYIDRVQLKQTNYKIFQAIIPSICLTHASNSYLGDPRSQQGSLEFQRRS